MIYLSTNGTGFAGKEQDMDGKMKTNKKEVQRRHHGHAPTNARSRIGKTTPTQYIYRKQEVQKHFDVKVWICITQL